MNTIFWIFIACIIAIFIDLISDLIKKMKKMKLIRRIEVKLFGLPPNKEEMSEGKQNGKKRRI